MYSIKIQEYKYKLNLGIRYIQAISTVGIAFFIVKNKSVCRNTLKT